MSHETRRSFLKKSVAAGAAFSTFAISGTKSSGRVIGANDTIRVAVAGIKGRGRSHIDGFGGLDKVKVTHLVDPDSRLGHGGYEFHQDIRNVLDDDSVDVVTIATPNHWHSLMTIWACEAGKDVYVEKPLSHNVSEGRKCVEAARKYNRMVQHGTQQRSSESRAREIAAVQSGRYGKLLVSKGYCCKPRWSIGTKEFRDPPSELDFNIWLGPAPKQPYHENLVHYNWHWFWDFGNGDTGNQGVHEMDVARWAIPGGTLPRGVWSLGGRFGYEDQGQTPNTQLAVFDYGDVTLLFETRGMVGKHDGFSHTVRNEYYTTAGMIVNGQFHPKDGGGPESISADPIRKITPGGPFGSFIAAVRSRKVEDLNADVEVGHYSAALCHLGNISYRMGSDVPFDTHNKALGDNRQIVDAFETVKANCRAVGMNLADSTYRLGKTLQFDPETEKFIGNGDADQMLTRPYRAPFKFDHIV